MWTEEASEKSSHAWDEIDNDFMMTITMPMSVYRGYVRSLNSDSKCLKMSIQTNKHHKTPFEIHFQGLLFEKIICVNQYLFNNPAAGVLPKCNVLPVASLFRMWCAKTQYRVPSYRKRCLYKFRSSSPLLNFDIDLNNCITLSLTFVVPTDQKRTVHFWAALHFCSIANYVTSWLKWLWMI